MTTPRRTVRAAVGAALALALLMPALRARAVMADQFADATSPVDNPKTPGPDLYAGRNFDLIPDMPDPVAMVAVSEPEPLPEPLPSSVSSSVEPARAACPAPRDTPARGPPSR